MIYYLGIRFTRQTNNQLSDCRVTNDLVRYPMPGLGFHSTIIYSRTPFRYTTECFPQSVGVANNWALFGDHLVLRYESPWLQVLFRACKASGGTSGYEPFRPHVTIAEKVTALDLETLEIEAVDLVPKEIFYAEWHHD